MYVTYWIALLFFENEGDRVTEKDCPGLAVRLNPTAHDFGRFFPAFSAVDP